MTFRNVLRTKALSNARRRPGSIVDVNADRTYIRTTGDPRLDLALAVDRASLR